MRPALPSSCARKRGGLLATAVGALTLATACQPPATTGGGFTEPGDDPRNPGKSGEDLGTDHDGGWPPGMSVVCELGASDGLVAHWSGDDGLFDEVNANDGYVVPLAPTGEWGEIERQPPTGSSAPIAPGHDGEAFDFDGSWFVEVPDAPELNPTVGISLAAWVKVTGGTTYLDIVGKDGETESRQYMLGVSNGWRFRPHLGTVERYRYFDGATPVQVNAWYHVVMTYDVPSGELILYVNGDEDGRQVVPEGRRCISVTQQPVRIGGGAPAGRGQLPFYGLIDDVRIYDRALTVDDVRQLYDLQEPEVPPLVPASGEPAEP
jgi:hypothetical protein